MTIVIIGPGALGCLIGGSLLLRAAFPPIDLFFLDRDPERAHRLTGQGLRFDTVDGHSHLLEVTATAEPASIGQAGVVLLCVKAGGLPSALAQAGTMLHENSLLIALQNGIAHLPLLLESGLPGALAVGTTAQGATLLAPGHVRHAGRGPTRIGLLRGSNEAAGYLEDLCLLLDRAGLDCETVADVTPHLWAKLLVNVGINALTALHGCKNGALLDSPEWLATLTAAVEEAAAVARAKGIPVENDPVARTVAVCRATAGNTSSMLQDVLKKKATEIEAINGAVVGLADELGLAVPVNRFLLEQVRALEHGYKARGS